MIDLLIMGSSRPQLWGYMWDSFQDYVHWRNPYTVFMHEDFIYPEKSEAALSLASNFIKNLDSHYHDPPIGLGPAMDYMFRWINEIKVDTKYIFYMQDDWEFERPIDVEQLVWIMERNPDINCIFFNKYPNFPTLNGIEQPQCTVDNVDMCLYHSWTFLPGIWRMSHVRKYWRVRKERPEGYFTNAFGTHEQRSDHNYAIKNLGVYMLGKQNDPRYVRHLGDDWRMAEWRMKDGKPGGSYDPEVMDDPYRAKWLPSLEDRPHRKKQYTKEEIEKLIGEEPEEARCQQKMR